MLWFAVALFCNECQQDESLTQTQLCSTAFHESPPSSLKRDILGWQRNNPHKIPTFLKKREMAIYKDQDPGSVSQLQPAMQFYLQSIKEMLDPT